jgi:putative FmdB family regulatory protein
MPTYEYDCKECSYNFEIFQSMSDEPLKICPKCGKEIRRLIFFVAGVIFKGSGFYITDKVADKGKGKGTGGKTSGTESKTAETASGASQTASTEANKTTGSCAEYCPGKTSGDCKAKQDAQSA